MSGESPNISDDKELYSEQSNKNFLSRGERARLRYLARLEEQKKLAEAKREEIQEERTLSGFLNLVHNLFTWLKLKRGPITRISGTLIVIAAFIGFFSDTLSLWDRFNPTPTPIPTSTNTPPPPTATFTPTETATSIPTAIPPTAIQRSIATPPPTPVTTPSSADSSNNLIWGAIILIGVALVFFNFIYEIIKFIVELPIKFYNWIQDQIRWHRFTRIIQSFLEERDIVCVECLSEQSWAKKYKDLPQKLMEYADRHSNGVKPYGATSHYEIEQHVLQHHSHPEMTKGDLANKVSLYMSKKMYYFARRPTWFETLWEYIKSSLPSTGELVVMLVVAAVIIVVAISLISTFLPNSGF